MREVYLFNILLIKSFIKQNKKYLTSNHLFVLLIRTQLYFFQFLFEAE